jgi:hypothetical protein
MLSDLSSMWFGWGCHLTLMNSVNPFVLSLLKGGNLKSP